MFKNLEQTIDYFNQRIGVLTVSEASEAHYQLRYLRQILKRFQLAIALATTKLRYVIYLRMYTEVRTARDKGGKSRVGATIAREELKKKLERGDRFFLLERLPEKYYRRAHLPGAMNLPPDRVSEVAPELVSDKSAEVVVYCGSFR